MSGAEGRRPRPTDVAGWAEGLELRGGGESDGSGAFLSEGRERLRVKGLGTGLRRGAVEARGGRSLWAAGGGAGLRPGGS